LGPDFHPLDRTSLRLAHVFDHLVGDRKAMDKQLEFSLRQIQNRSSGKSGTAATTPTAQAKSKPQATPGGRRADKHRRCHVTPRLRRLVD